MATEKNRRTGGIQQQQKQKETHIDILMPKFIRVGDDAVKWDVCVCFSFREICRNRGNEK